MCQRIFFPKVQQPLVGQDFPITKASQLTRLLCMSDKPKAETCIWQQATLTRDTHPCPWVGFETTIPACDQMRTHALDCTVTGIVLQDYWIHPSVKLTKDGFLRNYCHPFCLSLYIQK